MWRILRAFVWLRWRTLVNALERTGSRDVMARVSVATEELGPLLMALVMAPSALALGGLAGYAGWGLAADGERPAALGVVRFVLAAACVLALAAPVLLPAGDRTNAARFLLLPISRRVLYAAHALAMSTHPMLLLVAVMVLSLPAGLLAAGHPAATAVALLAGGLLLAVLAGILSAVTAGVQILLQDRRRGEWITLVLFLFVPVFGVMAGLIEGQRSARDTSRAERHAPQPTTMDRRALALLPSELYVTAVRDAAASRPLAAAMPLLTLAAAAGLVHAVAAACFGRLLGSVTTGGPRRRAARLSARHWRVPGLPTGASAIALNQVRLALRTPRGRFTLLSPLVMFVIIAAMLLGSPSGIELALLRLQGGIGLATFTFVVSLLAMLPLTMNQFAIDRSGLTLALLLPLDTRGLIVGKIAGNGMVAAMPVTIGLAAAAALLPGGDPALWACVPLAFVTTYLFTAPVAIALSTIFPRRVDLNSIGHGSNAHGAAALLGTLALAAAALSCLLPVGLATGLLNRPRLAPLLLLVWGLIATALCVVLLGPLAALFDRRRESFVMLR